jgi:hypothetical protein
LFSNKIFEGEDFDFLGFCDEMEEILGKKGLSAKEIIKESFEKSEHFVRPKKYKYWNTFEEDNLEKVDKSEFESILEKFHLSF